MHAKGAMDMAKNSNAPRLFIDLSAVVKNFRAVQALVAESVEVSAVVKSDAYGLGLAQIVKPLADAGCQSFFVADLQEAAKVRRRLPTVTIFDLGGYRSEHKCRYRSNRIIPVCHTLGEARAASSNTFPYALNLETGFSRLGLNLHGLRRFLHCQVAPPVLVMSHLACADDPSHPLNGLQRDRFCGMAGLLGGVRRSLAASAGVSLGKEFHFDQVRVGSALFGLNNAGLNPNPFVPVLRMVARIIDVRFVHAGETVGYMATFRAIRSTWIAIIAVGYVHGLAWSVGNRMSVEIGSYQAPLLGRISMEYAAIDVTDVPASLRKPGSWVDIIGMSHPLEEIANEAATAPQELLLRVGRSCQRHYQTEGRRFG